jgi:MazG family protein
MEKKKNNLEKLLNTIETLRGPNGCPWDKEQTMKTLKPCLIEEAYEVLEVMEEGGTKLKEELGDLLLQILLQSQIQKEAGNFEFDDVCSVLNEKLIRRHPHVFGSVNVKNSDEVMVNWEEIKRGEESHKDRESILDGIPSSFPQLLRAQKLQKKASKAGFDWENHIGAMEKVKEEILEIEEEIKNDNQKNIEEEIGDLIFAVINLSRKLKVNPEDALEKTNNKFEKRVRYIESKLDMKKSSLEEMEKYWQEAKNETR